MANYGPDMKQFGKPVEMAIVYEQTEILKLLIENGAVMVNTGKEFNALVYTLGLTGTTPKEIYEIIINHMATSHLNVLYQNKSLLDNCIKRLGKDSPIIKLMRNNGALVTSGVRYLINNPQEAKALAEKESKRKQEIWHKMVADGESNKTIHEYIKREYRKVGRIYKDDLIDSMITMRMNEQKGDWEEKLQKTNDFLKKIGTDTVNKGKLEKIKKKLSANIEKLNLEIQINALEIEKKRLEDMDCKPSYVFGFKRVPKGCEKHKEKIQEKENQIAKKTEEKKKYNLKF